jgi:uroporphyrinogen decarboxylase
MDRRERLLAVLAGEKVDRVPCAFWHHYADDCKFGDSSIRAHLNFFQEAPCDVFKVMNEHMFHIGESIKRPEDWKTIRQEPFASSPYPSLVDEVKAIRKGLPSDLPVFVTVHGVLVSAYHATEVPGNFSNPNNMVSSHLREDPESVACGLQIIADSLIALCIKLLETGVDGIYYAALGGESYRFSKELLETYVVPFDKQVIDAIKREGGLSILHICKDKVQLPSYATIDADIINWDVHDCPYPLASGRTIFPGKTLLGGFDDRSGILVEGTKTEIEEEARNIVSEAGRERLIIGADCTLPENIEPWRIQTVVKLSKQL